MLLLGVDVETNGLDPNKNQIIEVGLALYDTFSKTILTQASSLCYASSNDAYPINFISQASLDVMKRYPLTFFQRNFSILAQALLEAADVLVAHNASFDRRFLLKTEEGDLWNRKPWICTRNNIDWGHLPNKKLSSVCEAMGIPYVNAHRALNDVQLIFACAARLPSFEHQVKDLLNVSYEALVNE